MVELNSKKLLVVDDSLIARMAITKMLSGKVASITEATNGSEVLQLLDDNNFNLLLIDLEMPVKNGFETIFEIRKNKKTGYNEPVQI